VTRVEGETVHVGLLVTVDDVVLDVVEEVLAAVVTANFIFIYINAISFQVGLYL